MADPQDEPVEANVKYSSVPWYRIPTVWLIVLIPVSAVVVGAVILWFAVSTDDGLVSDDYYKEGLAINRNLERDQRAKKNKVSAEIDLFNDEGLIKMTFNKGVLESYPPSMELKLSHATREGFDEDVQLNHGQDNKYIGYISQPLSEGVWYMELNCGDWRLNARANITDRTNRVKLKAGS